MDIRRETDAPYNLKNWTYWRKIFFVVTAERCFLFWLDKFVPRPCITAEHECKIQWDASRSNASHGCVKTWRNSRRTFKTTLQGRLRATHAIAYGIPREILRNTASRFTSRLMERMDAITGNQAFSRRTVKHKFIESQRKQTYLYSPCKLDLPCFLTIKRFITFASLIRVFNTERLTMFSFSVYRSSVVIFREIINWSKCVYRTFESADIWKISFSNSFDARCSLERIVCENQLTVTTNFIS